MLNGQIGVCCTDLISVTEIGMCTPISNYCSKVTCWIHCRICISLSCNKNAHFQTTIYLSINQETPKTMLHNQTLLPRKIV